MPRIISKNDDTNEVINPVSTDERFEPRPDRAMDKISIMDNMMRVHSRISKDVSNDFVFAKLDDKDKEFITEMTSNAYYCKNLIMRIKKGAERNGRWEWDRKEHKWKRTKYSNDYINMIQANGDAIFDMFMTKIYMLVILNRNVKSNPLLRIMAGMPESEEDEDKSKELTVNQMKELLKNEEEKASRKG